MSPIRSIAIAAALLLIGATRHYGWDFFPVSMKGTAAKMLGGCALLAMIWVAYTLRPSLLALPVCIWWSWEELQVILCSAAYMVSPWVVPDGQSICSAKLGFDIGAASIIAVAVIARFLSVRSDSA